MYTIDESLNDTDFTAAGSVGAVFGTPRRYESITIHHWGSFGQSHDGVVNFFMKPNSPTSCHFVASDSRIHCLVSPQDASWAAGNAYGNATSIHIEARPEATDGDYRTISWLVSFIREYYGDLPLRGHNSWTATACPGKWDLGRVDREARAWANQPAPAPAVPGPSPAPSHRQPGIGEFRVDPGDTLSGIAVQFGETLEGLIAANPGINPDVIHVGQILNHSKPAVAGLPPYCFVDKGDTFSGIAAQYGVTFGYLLSRNPGIDVNLIFPGQRINL